MWRFLKKLKIEPPYDAALPLLGIQPQKILVWKCTCNPRFIIALFTIAKTWKQPKCPSTEKWIKKMWYTYTVKYYSAIKNETMPFVVTWMDLEIIILNEASQTDKEKYITYTWDLKSGYNWTYLQTETDSQTWRMNLRFAGGKYE